MTVWSKPCQDALKQRGHCTKLGTSPALYMNTRRGELVPRDLTGVRHSAEFEVPGGAGRLS